MQGEDTTLDSSVASQTFNELALTQSESIEHLSTAVLNPESRF